jgi:protein gp37
MRQEKKGKKSIEYADRSWNPITGCTHYGNDKLCAVWRWCWGHKMACRLAGRFGYDAKNPFKPTFHEDKLEVPYRWHKPMRVDTCFMGDMFSNGMPTEWILRVLKVIEENPRHRFYLLTKNPSRMREFTFSENAWVGVTVNRQSDVYRIDEVRGVKAKIRYVSLEPIYERIHADFSNIQWVILGAQTSPELQPRREWVEHILELADGIPVFMKDNLRWDGSRRCEFPIY